MPIKQTSYSSQQEAFHRRNSPISATNEHGENRPHSSMGEHTKVPSRLESNIPLDIEPTSFPFSTLNILIAEDHTANREYSKKMLTKLGYFPKTASNGLNVLESVQASPCDIILMDCYMPDVDGREAAKSIRNMEAENLLPNQRPIHIIGVSANSSLSEKRACLAAGMNDFICKPLLRNPLNEMLMHLWIKHNLNTLDQTMAEELINEFEEVATTLENLRKEIGTEATNELIQDFMQGTPARLDEMQSALDTKEMADLRRIAHSYKSVCQIYGLGLMSSLCAKLELQALSNNKEEAQMLIRQIQQLFNAVLPVVKNAVTSTD